MLVLEFIRLQIAGNILFLGTMLGFYIGERILHAPALTSLIVASILANILFFIADRDWVFTAEGVRKSPGQVKRFIVFMAFNFVCNIILIELLAQAIGHMSEVFIGYERYAAQCVAALFFSVWTYLGLKFWVFAPLKHYRHQALTIRPVRKRPRKRARA